MTKKNKVVCSALAAILSLSILSVSAYAIFSDSEIDDTTLTTGDVAISASVEDVVNAASYTTAGTSSLKINDSGDTVDAVVYNIESTGSKRSYIRAIVFPVVQKNVNGEWVTDTSTSVDDVTLYVSASSDATSNSWIYSDGYYYFPNVLASGETATMYVGSDYTETTDTRIVYSIEVEASQATNGAYATNWGIQGLPAGVEILSESY